MSSDIPVWIPCTACHHERQFHVDKKCPFDSTEFRPSDDVVALIMGELEYLNSEISTSPSPGFSPRGRGIVCPWERFPSTYESVATSKRLKSSSIRWSGS